MHKLTLDQQQELEEIKQAPGRIPLYLELENRVIAFENDVLTASVAEDDGKDLIYKKLKAEGARRLLRDLQKMLGLEPKAKRP